MSSLYLCDIVADNEGIFAEVVSAVCAKVEDVEKKEQVNEL